MRLHFEVTGSKGNVYEVKVEKEGANINAYCTCQAGVNGLYCKHRFALMDGDISNLASRNPQDVEKFRIAMRGTDLEAAYKEFLKADTQFQEAKKSLDGAKKNLAKAMFR